jgi:hypothetical protein
VQLVWAESLRNIVEKDLTVQAWIEDTIAIFMRDILFRFKDQAFAYIEPKVEFTPNASDSDHYMS